MARQILYLALMFIAIVGAFAADAPTTSPSPKSSKSPAAAPQKSEDASESPKASSPTASDSAAESPNADESSSAATTPSSYDSSASSPSGEESEAPSSDVSGASEADVSSPPTPTEDGSPVFGPAADVASNEAPAPSVNQANGLKGSFIAGFGATVAGLFFLSF